MAVWKVLLVGLLACVCLALALATLVVPIAQPGNARWAWLGGLLSATVAATGLFALFLRYAGGELALTGRAARR